jgi:hypothetical protein
MVGEGSLFRRKRRILGPKASGRSQIRAPEEDFRAHSVPQPLTIGLMAAIFAVAIYAAISLIAGGFVVLYAAFSAIGAFLIGTLLTLALAQRN